MATYREKLTPLIGDMQRPQEPWRWLDIGAGFGELVEAVMEVSPRGSDIRGIEPCQPKVNKARSKNLPVSCKVAF